MKNVIGIIPLVLAFPSYLSYINGVLAQKTIPHMYSWLIWSVLALIGFVAQINSNAGPGAWNTGITALACFVVFMFAIRYGEQRLTRLDMALLLIAIVAIISRLVTDSYTIATLLATLAACIGFIFTIKKAYILPYEENSLTFFVNAIRNLISLFALSVIGFNTFFYPFCMMLTNFAVCTVVLQRRSKTMSTKI